MGAFKIVKLVDPIYIATGGVALAHTGATATSGTFLLAEGNNITFSTNGNTVTIHGGAGAGGGVGIAAGTQTGNTGTINFANSNGITFGMSGSTRITASHNGITLQTTQPVAFSAANGSANFSTINFANSNGVSFSTGTQGVFATIKTDYLTTAAQSNQVINSFNGSTGAVSIATGSSLSASSNGSTVTIGLASNITTALQSAGAYLTTAALSNHSHAFSASGGSSAFQTLTFANSNGITFSNSNGSIVASHNALTTARASNDAIGLNTAKTNVTWTVNSNGISFDASGYAGTGTSATNASITLNSNGLAISIAPGGGGADGYNILAAGTQTAATTGSVLFNNANGITFGMSNSSVITASHNGLTTAAQSNQVVNALNGSTGSISLAAGSSLSSSSNGSTITFGLASNITTALQSAGAYLTTAMQSNAATISNIRVSAGTTSNLLSALTFSDGNGVSFGINASTVTATVKTDYLTSQSNQAVSANNGSYAFQTLSFSNANGISFGTSAGSAVTASHNALTTARASNDAVGLNTAQSNVTWTVNSSGVSFDARGYAGTGTSKTGGVAITLNSNGIAFDGAGLAGTNTTFNGANISGSMTINTAGVNLSLSAAAPGAGGGAALSAGANSQNTGTVNFANSNGITFGLSNNGTMTASFSAPAVSNSAGSFTFQTLNFSNANNVTFGTSAGSIVTASVAAPGAAAENNWVNLLGANTAGNTTASGSTVGYSGINLTLSGTNGSVVNISAPATSSLAATGLVSISTNGSTISIGVGSTLSNLLIAPNAGKGGPLPFAQSSISLGQNSLYFYPVQFEDYVSMDHIRMPVFVTNSSSAAASVQKGLTFQLGIYTRNATNNTVYTRHYSTSYTIAASHNSNVSWGLSVITGIGNSTSYNTLTASSAGINLSASLHGQRELILPVSSVFAPGEYWVGVRASSSSVGAGGAVLNISNLAVAHATYNRIGLSTASSNSGWFQQVGMGLYSVTTGGLPGGISQTQINLMGTQPILFAATGTV